MLAAFGGGRSQPSVETVDTRSLGLLPEPLGDLFPRRVARMYDGMKTGLQGRELFPFKVQLEHACMLKGGGQTGKRT